MSPMSSAHGPAPSSTTSVGRVDGSIEVADDIARDAHLVRELGGQARLADARGPGERDHATVAGAGGVPVRAQALQLRLPAHERWPRGRRGLERRRVREHIPLQLLQRRPGLQARLLDEAAAHVLIDLERLDLAPAAVEREHQQLGEALARRMLRPQACQRGDRVRVVAECEFGLGTGFIRRQPLLLQARDLRPDGAFELGERGTAPGGERLRQPLGSPPLGCPSASMRRPSAIALSKRSRSSSPGATVRRYPAGVLTIRSGSPSAFRSREM